MIARLCAWIERRRRRLQYAHYCRGYDLIAGALLRGGDPLEIELDLNHAWFEDEYDRGVGDALRDWAALANRRSK